MARGVASWAQSPSMAGRSRSDLRPGQETVSTAQAGWGDARDASGNRECSHRCLTGTGPLWTAQHCLYRTGESDRPPWGSSTGSPDLGHRTTVSSTPGPSGVVAGLLSFCAPPHLTPSGLRAAPRARGQTSGATLSPAHSSHGRQQNFPTMDGGGSPLFSPAAGPRLCLVRVPEAGRGSAK